MKNSILLRNILFAALLLQSSVCCFESRGAAWDVDLSFNGGSGVNGPIQAVAVQPDGKAIICGWFTTVQGHMRNGIARLDLDGTGDPTFNPTAAGTWPVSSLALQPDGKVLVGNTRVVRLHADGSWDNSFTNILDEQIGEYGPIVYAIAVQPDRKVLIGGYFSYVNGTLHPNIARLNADGTLDGSFTPPASVVEAHTLVLQPDGKVLVGGVFDHQGIFRQTLFRLNANGSLDNSFNPTEAPVYSLALQPDGKVILGGAFFDIQGTNRAYIARLNSSGSVDPSFNQATNFPTVPSSLVLQPDGKLIACGMIAYSNVVLRLHADGSLDNSFEVTAAPAGGNFAFITLQPDGRILIAGDFVTFRGVTRNRIARLNANGSVDESYARGLGVNSSVSSVLSLPNGQTFISGSFTTVSAMNRVGMARLHADGSGDSGFDSGIYAGHHNRIAAQPDGRILWAGFGIGRVNANGTPDPTFNPDLGPLPPTGDYFTASSIAVQPDGKILIAGAATGYRCDEFENCGYISTPFFRRFNIDGTRDPSFNAGTNIDGGKIVIQPDGKVLISGRFFINSNLYRLIRLHSNGTLDNTFTPVSSAGLISALLLQPDGKIFIAGDFVTVNGTNRRRVARLHANGSLDTSFSSGTGPDGPVYAGALQGDGKVIIGGSFLTVNNTNRRCLARFNTNGSVDNDFNVSIGSVYPDYGPVVQAITIRPDGSIMIGGGFLTVNGVLRPNIARLYGDAVVAPSLNIVRSNAFATVSWPMTAINFQLQESTNLSLLNGWSSVTVPRSTNNSVISVTPATTGSRKFFRLIAP